MPVHPAEQAFWTTERVSPKVLDNDDYAAGGIQLKPIDRLVHTTPGAAGVLALKLPALCDVPMGAMFHIWHFGTTNNTTVDDLNDGVVAVGQAVLTADKDHTVYISCGDFWFLAVDVTT